MDPNDSVDIGGEAADALVALDDILFRTTDAKGQVPPIKSKPDATAPTTSVSFAQVNALRDAIRNFVNSMPDTTALTDKQDGSGDGQTGDGQTGDGQTDDGQTDDGQTDDGQTDDGQTDDGQTDDGQTDDGQDDGGQGDPPGG